MDFVQITSTPLPPPPNLDNLYHFLWTPMCQKWAGASPSLPIPKLTQYIQFVEVDKKFAPPQSKRTATFFVKPSLSKWALVHNTLKNLEFRKKNPISKKCVFHLFHLQIDYCVFNMTDFLYVLWYSTDFAGVVLVQTNIASIQSFLRPGLYVFAEPYCLSSANMCSSFQENSRPWSQRISKIVGIYYIQIKVILLRLWCFFFS